MNPDMSLPAASIDEAQRLIFKTSQDQDVAWKLGVFYLKAPDWLDLEVARHFGRDILDPESPYRISLSTVSSRALSRSRITSRLSSLCGAIVGMSTIQLR